MPSVILSLPPTPAAEPVTPLADDAPPEAAPEATPEANSEQPLPQAPPQTVLPPLPVTQVPVRPRAELRPPTEPKPWSFEGGGGGNTRSPARSSGGGRVSDIRIIGPTMLAVAGRPQTLDGIAPPAPEAVCPSPDTPGRRCVDAAMTLLASRIDRHAPLTCQPRGAAVACSDATGVDLGRLLVEQGLALPLPGSPPDYGVAESQARAGRLGLWAR